MDSIITDLKAGRGKKRINRNAKRGEASTLHCYHPKRGRKGRVDEEAVYNVVLVTN